LLALLFVSAHLLSHLPSPLILAEGWTAHTPLSLVFAGGRWITGCVMMRGGRVGRAVREVNITSLFGGEGAARAASYFPLHTLFSLL
jgi:hypothetical protein